MSLCNLLCQDVDHWDVITAVIGPDMCMAVQVPLLQHCSGHYPGPGESDTCPLPRPKPAGQEADSSEALSLHLGTAA